jgi:hypothetical protein
MAFQIVEFTVDADDKVVERKIVPYPYQTRQEAVDTIESIAGRYAKFGYDAKQDFWWARTENGDRTRFRRVMRPAAWERLPLYLVIQGGAGEFYAPPADVVDWRSSPLRCRGAGYQILCWS